MVIDKKEMQAGFQIPAEDSIDMTVTMRELKAISSFAVDYATSQNDYERGLLQFRFSNRVGDPVRIDAHFSSRFHASMWLSTRGVPDVEPAEADPRNAAPARRNDVPRTSRRSEVPILTPDVSFEIPWAPSPKAPAGPPPKRARMSITSFASQSVIAQQSFCPQRSPTPVQESPLRRQMQEQQLQQELFVQKEPVQHQLQTEQMRHQMQPKEPEELQPEQMVRQIQPPPRQEEYQQGQHRQPEPTRQEEYQQGQHRQQQEHSHRQIQPEPLQPEQMYRHRQSEPPRQEEYQQGQYRKPQQEHSYRQVHEAPRQSISELPLPSEPTNPERPMERQETEKERIRRIRQMFAFLPNSGSESEGDGTVSPSQRSLPGVSVEDWNPLDKLW